MDFSDKTIGELKKWIIHNMVAIEIGMLEQEKKDLFLGLIEGNEQQPIFKECFKQFEKIQKQLNQR